MLCARLWACVTSTQYTHELFRHLCYDDKKTPLFNYQDIDDSTSSIVELEWLAWLENQHNIVLERQKVLPFKVVVKRGKVLFEKSDNDDEVDPALKKLSFYHCIPDGYYEHEGKKICYFFLLVLWITQTPQTDTTDITDITETQTP